MLQDVQTNDIENVELGGRSSERGALVRVEMSPDGTQALLLFESGAAKLLVHYPGKPTQVRDVDHLHLVGGALVERGPLLPTANRRQ